MLLGLVADVVLPFWWACAATIPYPFRCMVGRLPQRLVLGRLGVNERYRRFFAN